MSETLKNKILNGLFWRNTERFGTIAVGFAVSVILARLLEPRDYGIIALITVFIALANVLVTGGFGSALVQKKDVSEEDYSSVFYLTVGISIFVYGILFISAPWISKFYNNPALTLVLRVLSLSIIVGAFNSIQSAVLSREMKFKLSFSVGLVSILVSGIVGVGMAYGGYGVWSLVGMALAAQLATTLVSWKIIRWRPKLLFSYAAIGEMFSFGSKMLASSLLATVFNNINNIVIGKLFSPTVLGYYSRGQSIPVMIMTSVEGTISSVIFPALSACQNDKDRIKKIVRRVIKISCFIVFPSMFGLAVIAKPMVLILFTDKWLPCVPYLQLSCISFALLPLHVINLQAIAAIGRSDLFLTLEIINKALIVISIIITFRYGIMALLIGQAVCSAIAVVTTNWPNKNIFNYSLRQQILDMLPPALLSACMAFVVWSLSYVIQNIYFLIITQITVGAVFYILGAMLFKFDSIDYLRRTGVRFLPLKLHQSI